MKLTGVLIGLIISFPFLYAQAQSGCTDLKAINYDPDAIRNDGSCRYDTPDLKPDKITSLDKKLVECSGLVKSGEDYWALNDSGNSNTLYKVDIKNGEVLKEVFIKNFPNTDWEDLAVDDTYIYVGNFGNNRGNRKDLSIGKVALMDLENDTAAAIRIDISYADQYSFDLEKTNHDFDMEAMIAFGDSLYLFSKNWANGKTRVYACSKNEGSYVLHPKDSLNVKGQLTAADISTDGRSLVFLGYTREGKVWLFTMDNFKDHHFFKGNKRRYELGNALHLGQAEAICFSNDSTLLIGSEKFSIVKQQLFSLPLPGGSDFFQHKFPFPDHFSVNDFKNDIKKIELDFGRKLPVEAIEVRTLEGDIIERQEINKMTGSVEVSKPDYNQEFLLLVYVGKNVYIKRQNP